MDAVKTVLNHSKFLNRAQSRYIKLHDLHVGDIAPKILFINSVYKKVDIGAYFTNTPHLSCAKIINSGAPPPIHEYTMQGAMVYKNL